MKKNNLQRLNYFLAYWLPPIFWMILIFYFSSEQRIQVTGTFFFDFLIFKGLHMIEYAFLYFLLFRGFHSLGNAMSGNKKFILPLLIAVAYAISDEFHQTLVPTREGKLRDVLFDMGGAFFMYIYSKVFFRSIKKLL